MRGEEISWFGLGHVEYFSDGPDPGEGLEVTHVAVHGFYETPKINFLCRFSPLQGSFFGIQVTQVGVMSGESNCDGMFVRF